MSPEPIRTPGVFAVEPAESRLQSARVRPDDDPESSLRPRRLEEFVGQEALREQLGVSIAAASRRGEALDHVLLAGPPGLGKTSLAQIVAEELGVRFVQTAGPALERKADIAAFLTALEPGPCSSWTRSTACRARSRRRSIPRWRTASCRSRSARARAPRSSRSTCRRSRSSARPRAPACSRRRCATASASSTGSTTTRPTTSPASCGAARACWRSRSSQPAPARSPSAPAARRGSPTGCSSGCATSRRSGATARSAPPRPPGRWTCSRSTTRAWTAWTARSWA